jgi:hypothetical protein
MKTRLQYKLGDVVMEVDDDKVRQIVNKYIEKSGRNDFNQTEFIQLLFLVLSECDDLDCLLKHFECVRVSKV